MGGGGARGGDGRREPQEQNVHIATEGAERGRDRRAVHAIEAAGGRLQSGLREGGAGDVPERLEVPIRADGRDTGGGRAELRRPRERGAPDVGEQCQRRRPAGGRGVYRVPAGLRVEEQSELSRSCGGYQDEVDRVFEGFEEYLYLHKKLQSLLEGNKEVFQYRTKKRRREEDET